MQRIFYQDIPEGLFDRLMELEKFINSSTLETPLLELLRLRVAQRNGCAYCVDMHHKELRHLGESELRLSSLNIWNATPYFTEKERAVLRFTDALTTGGDRPLDEGVYQPLTVHFSKAEICFLTLAISQINSWTFLMKTFKFEPGKYQVNQYAEQAD